MLSSLAAGLAAGVGLYRFAAGATLFMMLVLWLVEFFEPPARKRFELRIKTNEAAEFRSKAEDVLKALGLEHELLVEDEDEIRYSRVGAGRRQDEGRLGHAASGRRRQPRRQVGRAKNADARTR